MNNIYYSSEFTKNVFRLKNRQIALAGLVFFSFNLFNVSAQAPIKKEVDVVKPYEPVVSDAKKINVLPKINDSVMVKPVFQYNVVPVMMNTEYQVQPITAAKMNTSPAEPLLHSYMKLGLGNYSTPLAEVYINSLRSKEYAAGLFFRHQSSGGKVTLDNAKSVDAGYSNTSVELFGKKFLESSYVYGDVGVSGNSVFDYGYNTTKPLLKDTTLEKGNIRQNYLLVSVNAGLRSSHSDSTALSYHVGLGYNRFQDRYSHSENDIKLMANLNQQFGNKMFGINTSFNWLKRNEKLDTTGYLNSLVAVNPWVELSSSQYKLRLGVNVNLVKEDNNFAARFYPNTEFTFEAVKEVLIPFVGLTGQTKNHSYRDMANENPFIRPDLLVKNSNTKMSLYGGFKGSLGARASYVIKADYSNVDNMYFFVNDTSLLLENQFKAVYSNVDIFNGYLEVNYDYNERLSFGMKGNLYQYSALTQEQYAWHKPSFDLTLSSKYNLHNQLFFNFDVLANGKRHVKTFTPGQSSKDLSGWLDFNLGVEYRHTKILSAWLKMNNITATKSYSWNQYPNQRFNVMIGFTYSL